MGPAAMCDVSRQELTVFHPPYGRMKIQTQRTENPTPSSIHKFHEIPLTPQKKLTDAEILPAGGTPKLHSYRETL